MKCPCCGEINDEGSVFCKKCGLQFRDRFEDGGKTQTQGSLPIWIGAVLGGLLGYLFRPQKNGFQSFVDYVVLEMNSNSLSAIFQVLEPVIESVAIGIIIGGIAGYLLTYILKNSK